MKKIALFFVAATMVFSLSRFPATNHTEDVAQKLADEFEQVGLIGQSLPRNDVQTTTQAGDIVLYSGDQIVVFYGSNSWAYTSRRMEDVLGRSPLAVFTQLEKLGRKGKKIMAAMTYEGSGLGSCERDLKRICSGASLERALQSMRRMPPIRKHGGGLSKRECLVIKISLIADFCHRLNKFRHWSIMCQSWLCLFVLFR